MPGQPGLRSCRARVVVLVNFRFVLVRPESYFRNEDFCFRAGSQSSKGRLVTAEDIAGPRSQDSRERGKTHHLIYETSHSRNKIRL